MQKQIGEQNKILSNLPFLQKLNTGLLLKNISKEMSEPGYTPIGRITKSRKLISREQEYCSDLIRVTDEAQLTTHLLKQTIQSTETAIRTYQPEEIIKYYNGIFLDEVHQIKDKILRLIRLLVFSEEEDAEHIELDPREVKLASFIQKHIEIINKIGIKELLDTWSTGSLQVALSKRTTHHHMVSTLHLDEDFQKIKLSRLMLSAGSFEMLSDYGKKKMSDIGDEAYKKWREDTIRKQEDTLNEIMQNIEQISEKLITYFSLPVELHETAIIAEDYTKYLKSMDITNICNADSIPANIRPLIYGFVDFVKTRLGEEVVAIYLVGSAARNEYNMGSSDINLYVILNTDKFESFTNRDAPANISAIFLSKEHFLEKSNQKHKFICWSDGVLIWGEKLDIEDSTYPKPGTLLSLLLNKDFEEELINIRNEVEKVDENDSTNLRKYSLKLAKVVMDFDFAVAMANKPFYTASRSKKIAYTKHMWPDEKRTSTIESIYNSGIIRKQDFAWMIDTFLEHGRKNLAKMREVETQILKENEKELTKSKEK